MLLCQPRPPGPFPVQWEGTRRPYHHQRVYRGARRQDRKLCWQKKWWWCNPHLPDCTTATFSCQASWPISALKESQKCTRHIIYKSGWLSKVVDENKLYIIYIVPSSVRSSPRTLQLHKITHHGTIMRQTIISLWYWDSQLVSRFLKTKYIYGFHHIASLK